MARRGFPVPSIQTTPYLERENDSKMPYFHSAQGRGCNDNHQWPHHHSSIQSSPYSSFRDRQRSQISPAMALMNAMKAQQQRQSRHSPFTCSSRTRHSPFSFGSPRSALFGQSSNSFSSSFSTPRTRLSAADRVYYSPRRVSAFGPMHPILTSSRQSSTYSRFHSPLLSRGYPPPAGLLPRRGRYCIGRDEEDDDVYADDPFWVDCFEEGPDGEEEGERCAWGRRQENEEEEEEDENEEGYFGQYGRHGGWPSYSSPYGGHGCHDHYGYGYGGGLSNGLLGGSRTTPSLFGFGGGLGYGRSHGCSGHGVW